MSSIPRNEYPRPQFVRDRWLCLNGEWQFEIDQGDSGIHRGLLERELTQRIIVPFCPESKLSGIDCQDFLNAVWYRRSIEVPSDWQDARLLLHFQAVDHDTTVWVDGVEVKRHRGGFSTFSCTLPGHLQAGDSFVLVVRARDRDDVPQARGKQARDYHGAGALYGRTTGIWQTVWMEPVPPTSLERARITPDVGNRLFRIEQPVRGEKRGLRVRARLSDAAGEIVSTEVAADRDFMPALSLPVPEARMTLWSIDNPHLYELTLELLGGDGAVMDSVASYAGMRSVSLDGKAVRINGEVIFQRLVLDQGFYPEGIMTAPSDAALREDILLGQKAGFNGARLHQKVFEERYLYHADKLGYIVWGEFGDWGSRGFGPQHDHQKFSLAYITEWLEVLSRDYSHPSIVGWCPLNETWQPIIDEITELDDVTHGMFLATKAMDLTRPVLDTSGYSHRVNDTDIYDSHDYSQDPAVLEANQTGLAQDKPYMNDWKKDPARYLSADPISRNDWSVPYQGQPYFVSEFGGIWWNPDLVGEDSAEAKDTQETGAGKKGSWGYGGRPANIEEFYHRFEALCTVLLENEDMFGYCYTQLTDVFQEENGIYRFDRAVKFDLDRLARVQKQLAAIEIKFRQG